MSYRISIDGLDWSVIPAAGVMSIAAVEPSTEVRVAVSVTVPPYVPVVGESTTMLAGAPIGAYEGAAGASGKTRARGNNSH